MQNSKLLELLRGFSGREWKSFRDFVNSPYFNRNGDVTALCNLLEEKTGNSDTLQRETVFRELFPGQAFDDARLNHLMSFLLKLAERFLGLERTNSHAPFTLSFHTLQALLERGLEKHYRYAVEQVRKKQNTNPYHDATFFLQRYQVEDFEAGYLSRSAGRRFNESVQLAADHLDQFYLAEKLRCTCYMLTSQVVLATPYNLQLVEEVRRFVAALREPEPIVQAYYLITCLLTDPAAFSDFEALKLLLTEQERHFPPPVLAELYQYAINYCNLQILKNHEPFVAEALDWYTRGVQSGILLEQGKLSPWHFKNMIKLGLRLKKYAWTEQFIRDNTGLLEPEFRDDAFHYNLAELYYYTGRSGEAQEQLNQVEFTDIYYNLGAKVILCKIFYETGELDALESLLHAFRAYLHRNRVIAEDLRQPYLHFTAILRRITRSTSKDAAALLDRIDRTVLAEKNWLLKVLDQDF
ncbi:MAG: hypothetical protein H6565_11105 [Lewinellaceae bacterium]|nr:hypothetical protein [Lewinellaceae bacterium]